LYGDSALSEPASQAIILTNPDPPVNLAEIIALRSITSISLSWDLGKNDGGSPIIDYQVSFDQAISVWTIRASNIKPNSYTVTGLTVGLTY
jgi:hypothetical protein